MLSSFQVSLYSSYVDGSTPQWCGDEGWKGPPCLHAMAQFPVDPARRKTRLRIKMHF